MTKDQTKLILTDRTHLHLDDVKEVESFDNDGATLVTSRGILTVEGSDIHIKNLDTAGGEVEILGKIDALIFASENDSKKRSLRNRLFG